MRLAILLVALSHLGCGRAGSSVASASEAVAPHREAFGDFDRWARRTCEGADVEQDRAALHETLFAPLRAQGDVRAAWVQLERHATAITLSLPSDVALSSVTPWVTVRDPSLGVLRVAATALCPKRAGETRTDAAKCVLLARSEPKAREGSITVTVAYRATE